MNIRKPLSIIMCASLLVLTSCNKSSELSNQQTEQEASIPSAEKTTDTASTLTALSGNYTEEEIAAVWNEKNATKIQFRADAIDINGSGAKSDKNTVRISQSGTYLLSGILTDGQIIVDAGDKDNIQIVLNNANLTSSTSSPLYIQNAKNVYLTLADNTTNTISDAAEYVYENSDEDEPNAAIFSKSDLIINGTGTLQVTGNYNNGIRCKDDLKIVDGTILVTSVDDGIIGKDSITIRTGDITVNSKGDAFKSTNTNDTSKGYIIVDGGNFTVVSGSDGFQAETALIVNGGTFDITTNGGSTNASTKENGGFNKDWGMPAERKSGKDSAVTTGSPDTNMIIANTDSSETAANEGTYTAQEDVASAKGFKAGAVLTLNDGVYYIDSSDDSIHSNGTLTITGGNYNIASGDDGIHADSLLTIEDGTILITKSYEGIESQNININGGIITLTASDDGINVSGGNDSSSINGRPGQNGFENSGNGVLTINGGIISVDANGDGLDANGSIVINGGTTYVSGPTDGGNGVLDYDQTFDMNGGVLMAAGSTGMAMTPSDSSTQPSIVMVYDSVQSEGTIVHLEDEAGNEVATFSPAKDYQFVIISSPALTNGTVYNLYTGGSYSTESINNVFKDGTYKTGALVHNFTISEVINSNTSITNNGGFNGNKGNQDWPGTKNSQGGFPDGQTGQKPQRPDGQESTNNGTDSDTSQ